MRVDTQSREQSRFMRDYPRGPSLAEQLPWIAIGTAMFIAIVVFFSTVGNLRIGAAIGGISFPVIGRLLVLLGRRVNKGVDDYIADHDVPWERNA